MGRPFVVLWVAGYQCRSPLREAGIRSLSRSPTADEETAAQTGAGSGLIIDAQRRFYLRTPEIYEVHIMISPGITR